MCRHTCAIMMPVIHGRIGRARAAVTQLSGSGMQDDIRHVYWYWYVHGRPITLTLK